MDWVVAIGQGLFYAIGIVLLTFKISFVVLKELKVRRGVRHAKNISDKKSIIDTDTKLLRKWYNGEQVTYHNSILAALKEYDKKYKNVNKL